MRFRKLPNGDLVVPARGEPPEAPAGYEQDPKDKYHYKLILEPCVYRNTVLIQSPCKKIRCFFECSLFNKQVNASICNDCLDLEEPQDEIP